MRYRAPLAIVAIAGGMTAAAWAHPPGADGLHHDVGHAHADPASMRSWMNARTGEVVRGAFLSVQNVDGIVKISIERENGDVVIFPLADLSEPDKAEAQQQIGKVKAINERLAAHAAAQPADAPPPRASDASKPPQTAPFEMFAPWVKTRWDERWLFIESDGLPRVPGANGAAEFSHPMMVGIRAWQQQVPLPQAYKGENAWRLPLKPELADKPVSAKEELFRGAIAIAANGVPIFNPIKNDGRTDTFLAGELDEFGGHCGRADDYHYHIAPLHLQKVLGKSTPVAYALDGFPIYGYFDAAAKAGDEKACPLGGTEELDELNGHFGPATKGASPNGNAGGSSVAGPGLYHYHASVAYPYLNGGMRGVVTVKEDQIDPQPRASSPRAALPPLRGAKITGFKATGNENEPAWSLEYILDGKKHFVNYRLENGKWEFDFVGPTGATKTESHDATKLERRPGGGGSRRARR